MSIRYDLYETPDIQQTGEQQPLHPRVVINGTVDQNEFLDRVHKFTGISRSLLSGAMQSFQNELRDLLANGWNVELGDIGYFSVMERFHRRAFRRFNIDAIMSPPFLEGFGLYQLPIAEGIEDVTGNWHHKGSGAGRVRRAVIGLYSGGGAFCCTGGGELLYRIFRGFRSYRGGILGNAGFGSSDGAGLGDGPFGVVFQSV